MARGRLPKDNTDPRRTERRVTRMTIEEARALDRVAAMRGFTVSDFLRMLALALTEEER